MYVMNSCPRIAAAASTVLLVVVAHARCVVTTHEHALLDTLCQ